MTVKDLQPGAVFRAPAVDLVGTLVWVGTGSAMVRWHRHDAEHQTRSFTDSRTGKLVTFKAPPEKAGPVTLALEVEPLAPEAI